MQVAQARGEQAPRKVGNLTLADVYGLAKEASVGGGRARDSCGVVAPFGLMSLDRIDASRPYEEGNVRIMWRPLNIFRRESLNDEVPDEYLGRIKGIKFARVQDFAAELPAMALTCRWMKGDGPRGHLREQRSSPQQKASAWSLRLAKM